VDSDLERKLAGHLSPGASVGLLPHPGDIFEATRQSVTSPVSEFGEREALGADADPVTANNVEKTEVVQRS
jgi:hypothetical protein